MHMVYRKKIMIIYFFLFFFFFAVRVTNVCNVLIFMNDESMGCIHKVKSFDLLPLYYECCDYFMNDAV